jgi:hypothetical protein
LLGKKALKPRFPTTRVVIAHAYRFWLVNRASIPTLALWVAFFGGFLTTEHHQVQLGALAPQNSLRVRFWGPPLPLDRASCCRELLWF